MAIGVELIQLMIDELKMVDFMLVSDFKEDRSAWAFAQSNQSLRFMITW